MAREIHDHFFREAKRQGWRSRAAFKLMEIDDKREVLGRGDLVLDCGCAPGSWMQVAAERIGPRGRVVGIDLKPIRLGEQDSLDPAQCVAVAADLATVPGSRLLELAAGGGFDADETATDADDGAVAEPAAAATDAAPTELRRFDVVLSDMAPSTTGDRTIDHHGSVRLCHLVLDRCRDVLAPGGRCVMKVLEGPAYPDLLARARKAFDRARGFKPKASREESTEIFLVAHGYRGADADPGEAGTAGRHERAHPPAPRGGPSRGWGG